MRATSLRVERALTAPDMHNIKMLKTFTVEGEMLAGGRGVGGNIPAWSFLCGKIF